MTKTFAIGIDAGVHTGIAIYDRFKKEITYHGTGDFWAVYGLIVNFQKPSDTVIVIETPKKNFIYPQRHGHNTNLVRETIAFRSGANNREATLLMEGFEKLGFEVIGQTPQTAKWSAADLKRYTGITDRTSEHCRDAIKLVFGI